MVQLQDCKKKERLAASIDGMMLNWLNSRRQIGLTDFGMLVLLTPASGVPHVTNRLVAKIEGREGDWRNRVSGELASWFLIYSRCSSFG